MQANITTRVGGLGRFLLLAGLIVAIIGGAPKSVIAGSIQLADESSTVRINTDTPAGVYDWVVSGQDQLAKEWWWLEVGGSRFSLDALGPANVTLDGLNKATASYSDLINGYSVDISFELTGSDFASAQSLLKEAVVIQNTSGSPLNISLFMYSDFELGGTPGGDSVSLLGFNDDNFPFGSSVWWERAGQSDGIFEHGVIYNGKPLLAELGADSVILDKLNNTTDDLALNAGVVLPPTAGSTTLDEYGPEGPGDMTYAIQWDFVIANGDSDGVGIDKTLVAPEPSTILLTALGLMAIWFRSRRNQ